MQNNIKEILSELGFEKFKPTPQLLRECGDMTIYRFNQIIRNEGHEMTVSERAYMEKWISRAIGESIDIFEDNAETIRHIRKQEVA